jgi:hypothetical protein
MKKEKIVATHGLSEGNLRANDADMSRKKGGKTQRKSSN